MKQTNASQTTSWTNCTLSAFSNECLEHCNMQLAKQALDRTIHPARHNAYHANEHALALRANTREHQLINTNTQYGAFVWQAQQNTLSLYLRRYGSTEIAGSERFETALAQLPVLRLHWHNGRFTFADDAPLER